MKYTLMFITLLAISLNQIFADDLNWKKSYTKNGLTIEKAHIAGSKLLAFKAHGVLNANLSKIIVVLRDVEGTSSWEKNTKNKVTLISKSDIEATTYSQNKIPWPFEDRDLVTNNLLTIDKENKKLVVTSESVTHPSRPHQKKHVRAHLKYADIKLYPLGPNKTDVELLVHIDPKGSIPDWLVNFVQEDMPYDFLKNLEKNANSREESPNAGCQKLINDFLNLIKS